MVASWAVDSAIRAQMVDPDANFSAAPHGSRDFPLGVPFRDRLALVELALASGQADLDLGMVAGEVNAQRDERVTLLLHLADQARDLLAVQQELARAQRVMVHDVALSVWRDVNVLQLELPLFPLQLGSDRCLGMVLFLRRELVEFLQSLDQEIRPHFAQPLRE